MLQLFIYIQIYFVENDRLSLSHEFILNIVTKEGICFNATVVMLNYVSVMYLSQNKVCML